MSSISTKYYAVVRGHVPGIYTDWDTASQNITKFPGSVHKSFNTREEAEEYMKSESSKTNASSAAPSGLHKIASLTSEQLNLISHLLDGSNIFLTGCGGCGKTYLLNAISSEFPTLKRHISTIQSPGTITKPVRIQMCAMTGCAALLLGSNVKTLHSWAGIGLGKGTVHELFIKIRRNSKAMRNWLCTDILVIDEISMMSADLLDKLNALGKRIRSNSKPFGGIQLLLVGDFYQLPPVNKTDEQTMFAFDADSWKECISVNVELTEIQRQKDAAFQKILKEARIAELSKESCNTLSKLMGRNWKENKIRPTLLFPRRAEVEMINDSNLRALSGKRYKYKARLVYDGKTPPDFSENDEQFQRALRSFDSDNSYLTELELVENTQVMLIANIEPESGLVNGSRGVIVGFCPSTGLPIVEFINGLTKTIGNHFWPIPEYEFVSRSQIPLLLAYAVTTHRSQGSSLDSALIDIGSSIFEYGQAYVALSRVRSLESLYIYDFDPKAFKAHPKVKEFYKKMSTRIRKLEDLDRLRHIVDSFNSISLNPDTHLVTTGNTLQPIRAVNVVKLESAVSEDPIEPLHPIRELKDAEDATDNWLYDSLPAEWKSPLESYSRKLLSISQFLSDKYYLPDSDKIWRALELTPLNTIKVVILGQDPYPNKEHACGLAFSVTPNVTQLPPSLKNIYKELSSDLTDFTIPKHGNLESWANQGVLLLNTVLTVNEGESQSHSKIGWEEVTDTIIRTIATQSERVVFVLWGKSAQAKRKLLNLYLDKNKHRVFESAHPSPLSAHRGFFGSKTFSTINTWLEELGRDPINW
jgi:uracil-DNA glycosylase